MRLFVTAFTMLGVALLVTTGPNYAQDKEKEVVLKGRITCNKCERMKSEKCETVLVVGKDKDEVVYFFGPKSHKKFHSGICKEGKQGTVTGVVKDEGKKKVISVTKIEYDK